jgi:hypothetical protein
MLLMDTTRMLTELRMQRDQVVEAIAVLHVSRMAGKNAGGRPPNWMAEAAGKTEAE